MEKINKHSDIIVNHYSENYKEEDRFASSKAKSFEYLTTMRYIEKFAKKGCKILEVGAGTGAYSITLAKMGYEVTAIELVPRHVEIMKERAKGIDNIKIYQGDALNLSMFEDNSFDIVLNLGPMYHLFNENDKRQAINESLRVCKHEGISMFAYIPHSSIVWNVGVRKNNMPAIKKWLGQDGKLTDAPEEIFASFYIEDFKKLFENTNTSYITNVATDSLAYCMYESIDSQMSDEDINSLLEWHFTTCERADQQGLSSHLLYICRKN